MSGVRSPFYSILTESLDLSDICVKLSYKYSEDNNDVCTITLRDAREDFPDEDYFREKTKFSVTFGYITPDGSESVTRLCYLQDVDFSFGTGWIEATITATEKAASMVSGTSKKVHKQTTSFGVAKDIAEKHGVDTFFLPYGPGVRPDAETAKKMKELNEKALTKYSDYERRVKITIDDLNDPKKFPKRTWSDTEAEAYRRSKSQGPAPLPFSKIDQRARNITTPAQLAEARANQQVLIDPYGIALKYLNSAPQAGKANRAFLKELFNREVDGPYIADTRDDSMIIRKRNFNQAPIKGYVYAGTEGVVKDFSPETKNKAKSSMAVMGYGAWNRNTKSYAGGLLANENNAVATHLAKYMNGINVLNEGISRGLWSKSSKLPDLTAYGLPKIKQGESQEFLTNTRGASTDNTRASIRVKAFVSVEKGIKALETVLSTFTDPATTAKYFPGYANDGPGDAYEQAANAQRNAELDRNPGTLTVEGDPLIEVGVVINIQGVGKRFSGNYYVTESEHTIDPQIGYETQISILRTGHNLPLSAGSVKVEETGKKVNDGGETNTSPTSKKTITSNDNK